MCTRWEQPYQSSVAQPRRVISQYDMSRLRRKVLIPCSLEKIRNRIMADRDDQVSFVNGLMHAIPLGEGR